MDEPHVFKPGEGHYKHRCVWVVEQPDGVERRCGELKGADCHKGEE